MAKAHQPRQVWKPQHHLDAKRQGLARNPEPTSIEIKHMHINIPRCTIARQSGSNLDSHNQRDKHQPPDQTDHKRSTETRPELPISRRKTSVRFLPHRNDFINTRTDPDANKTPQLSPIPISNSRCCLYYHQVIGGTPKRIQTPTCLACKAPNAGCAAGSTP